MDCKKRLNRAKQHDGAGSKTPQKVSDKNNEREFMDYCVSPDFPSSQECFTVGWDWSGQVKGNNHPTIHVVQRPVRKRKETELLECHRPRRIVRNYDPDIFDTSSFADQLKSLASGLKRVPESNSPVASSPHSSIKSRGHLVITPTCLRGSRKDPPSSTKVENNKNESFSSETPTHQTKPEGEKSLNDLFDDSLGADLVQFTQELEQDLKQNQGKTPKPSKNLQDGHSSSKKKSRLSLSIKKKTNVRNTVCRRIGDIYEATHDPAAEDCRGKKLLSNEKKDNANNNCVPLGMDLDDFDEATLLSINELEEKVMTKSNNPSRDINFSGSTKKLSKTDFDPALDDDFVSPDLLSVLDQCEKNATQTFAKVTNTIHLPGASTHKEKDLLDWIDEEHESMRQLDKKKDTGDRKNQIPSLRKDMSVASGGLKTLGQKSTSTSRENIKWIDGQRKENNQPDVEKDAGKSKNQPQCHKKSLSLTSGVLKCTPEEIEKKRQEARKRLTLKKRQS